MSTQKTKLRASVALMLLCWLVYASSYIGKVNYAANINQIMEFYRVDHASAGLVSTFFFFAYAVGQVFNGLFCKKYNLKWIIFGSLLVSGTVNCVVAFAQSFIIIKYFWMINGFAMSILWPSLIRLLSESLAKKDMEKASLVMGTTVATGTFLVYGLSALFVKINFKLIFYLATGLFFTVALVWIFSYSKLVSKARLESGEEKSQQIEKKEVEKQSFNKSLLMLSIVMLAGYGVATNLIKDGLTTWVPSILKEQYHLDSSFSIALTVLLPVVAIFGNAFAVALHKKVPDFVLQCALVFLCAGIIIGGVIGGISLNVFWITLIGFAIVCFLVSSCNSIITSIFPLFMKGKLNSGLIAGVLNGFCYVGSTISSYGLGALADHFGWIAVFWLLFFVCLGVSLSAGIYLIVRRFLQKKNTQE